MKKIGSFFVNHWVRFLIAFLMGIAVLITYLTIENRWPYLAAYYNGCFLAGFFLLCAAGLAFVGNSGFFNIFSFYADRKKIDGKKENYYEYSTRKQKQRSEFTLSFLPYLITALFFIIICFIIFLISKI